MARVGNGRIVLDEATDLPECEEIELVPIGCDDLDEEDRRRLRAALDVPRMMSKQGVFATPPTPLADLRRK